MTSDIHTIQELFVEVGDGHELYVHDWGNPDATMPILNLHGGPGSATSDSKKDLYDPSTQRVIFFDQRGCGRSLPYGSLVGNTTDNLIEDIQRITDKLKIDRFILRGGSWGSTLALNYGIAHPERVEAMVLDGIWTGSKDETEWIDQGLFQTFFPDVWQDYLDKTPKAHHDNPSSYHFPRILGTDQTAAKESAYAYSCLEGAVLTLNSTIKPEDFSSFDPVSTIIEVSYLSNGCFIPDRFVFDNTNKLTMPLYLVQGRYDMVCPPTAAYELSLRAPHAKLIMTVSGHAAERESRTAIRTLLGELTK